jgi:uncharacterized repeat protein (TIGR01451 family)
MIQARSTALFLWGLTTLVPLVAGAQGRAMGPDPRDVWEGNMDYAASAGSLLDCQEGTCAGSGNNCDGLDSGTIRLETIPETPDLRVVYAQVTWAASIPASALADREITLTPPRGAALNLMADDARSESFADAADAQTCELIPIICGGDSVNCNFTFFSHVADITDALNTHREGGGTLNGEWRISNVTIPGATDADPETAIMAFGSIVIGGWSLLVIYEDTVSLPLRRLYYYQGFELISGGERRLRPRGFLAPANPAVDLTFFALEGDSGTSGDSLSINGNEVQDACNPARNVFNDTVNSGLADGSCRQGTRGVDLDSFTLRDAIEPGDEDADVLITLPRGDGFITAGEQIFTNWLMIAFDHIPPSFESLKPEKSAQPPSRSVVQPGDPIDYLIVVENSGGDFATGVVVTDAPPEGTTYVAGSTVFDNLAVADLPNGTTALAGGLNITRLPGVERIGPGERHTVRFRVTVNQDTPEGAILTNIASIAADGVAAVRTDPVQHSVGVEPDGGFPIVDAQVPEDASTRLDQGFEDLDQGVPPGSEVGPCPPGTTRQGDECVPSLCREGLVFIDGECVVPPDAAPIDNLCGPGLRPDGLGGCALLCSTGTVWDPNCGSAGQCRAENAPACAASGGSSGCGCDLSGRTTAPVSLWIGLTAVVGLAGFRMRRRRV